MISYSFYLLVDCLFFNTLAMKVGLEKLEFLCVKEKSPLKGRTQKHQQHVYNIIHFLLYLFIYYFQYITKFKF